MSTETKLDSSTAAQNAAIDESENCVPSSTEKLQKEQTEKVAENLQKEQTQKVAENLQEEQIDKAKEILQKEQTDKEKAILKKQMDKEKAILQKETDKVTENELDPDTLCYGPCGWTPEYLQAFARPIPFLFCISFLVLVQSLLIGYASSILTTIEKRYSLTSGELGLIVGSYDFTCLVAGALVSYFGDMYNRPSWLGRGALIMAVGSALFAVPYFCSEQYDPSRFFHSESLNSSKTLFSKHLCNNSITKDLDCSEEQATPHWPLLVFMLAKMTLGLGSAPVYILGPTYLYDNVSPSCYSVYAGIMFSMVAIGPAVGFFMGAMVLTIYEHPGHAPPGLNTQHTAWVGAWWLGFVINTFLCILVALPLLMFPKRLPFTSTSTCTMTKEDVPERPPDAMSLNIHIKEMPTKIVELFSNGVWLSVSLVLIMEQSLASGYVTFIAKYFQVAFVVATSSANVLTGTVIIPGAFMGIIAGGFIMKHIQWDIPKTAKLLLIINFFPLCCIAGMMFLSCNNVNLAGITATYLYNDDVMHQKGNAIIKYKQNLTSPCNTACSCSLSNYEPVCGDDQITYFSPCHAGCTEIDVYMAHDGLLVKNYSDCHCIYEDFVHRAHSGKCQEECYNLAPFLILLFISIFTTCCGQNPSLVVTLRSVESSLKSFSLGMQYILVRLFAYMPAPVYFGQIFDSQCLLWRPSCSGRGSCLEYNRQSLPFMLFGTGLALKLLAYAAYVTIFVASNNKKKKEDKEKLLKSEEIKEVHMPEPLKIKKCEKLKDT